MLIVSIKKILYVMISKMVEILMPPIMSKSLIEFIIRALNSILLFLWSKDTFFLRSGQKIHETII